MSFIANRERSGAVGNKDGSMVLCEPGFMDKLIGKQMLPSEPVLERRVELLLERMVWENYLIYYTKLPNKDILLLIQ